MNDISTFRQELKKENLCTHFILPLLQLNRLSFVPSNFVDSFLSNDLKYIAVEVYEPLLSSVLTLKPVTVIPSKNTLTFYMVYSIPVEFHPDVKLFSQGKFSLMSNNTKDTIIRNSGLEYQEFAGLNEHTGEGIVITDGRLLALERNPLLRFLWEEYIEGEIGEDSELLDIPQADSYIENTWSEQY